MAYDSKRMHYCINCRETPQGQRVNDGLRVGNIVVPRPQRIRCVKCSFTSTVNVGFAGSDAMSNGAVSLFKTANGLPERGKPLGTLDWDMIKELWDARILHVIPQGKNLSFVLVSSEAVDPMVETFEKVNKDVLENDNLTVEGKRRILLDALRCLPQERHVVEECVEHEADSGAAMPEESGVSPESEPAAVAAETADMVMKIPGVNASAPQIPAGMLHLDDKHEADSGAAMPETPSIPELNPFQDEPAMTADESRQSGKGKGKKNK